jgi:cell division protein FtsA
MSKHHIVNQNMETYENNDYIAALDIGTSKLTISIGQMVGGKLQNFVGSIDVETSGIEQGRIVNINEVVKSLKTLVNDVESILGYQFDEVHVGISDPEIGIHENSAMVPITDHVTPHDINNVLRAAEAIPLRNHETILHVIPINFFVDRKIAVNPDGLSGVRLDVEARIVTIPTSSIEAITRVCTEAGLEAVEIIFNPLATSLAISSQRQQFLGTMIIDIGAGTTDIVIYEGNKIRYFDVIPAGGNYITSDLSSGLNCLKHEAEMVKLEYGSASPVFLSEEEEIIKPLSKSEFIPWDVSYQYVSTIIEARIREIFEMAAQHMSEAEVEIKDSFEIILTGGSSLLANMPKYIEDFFQLKTEVGIPSIPKGVWDQARNPMFSSSVGLIMFANLEQYTAAPIDTYPKRADSKNPNILHKVKTWMSSFFD